MTSWRRPLFVTGVLTAIALAATDATLALQACFGRSPFLASLGPVFAALGVVLFALRSNRS